MLKVEVWFGVSVSGKLNPLSVQIEPPLIAAAVTVRFDVPIFFKVSVCVAVVFTRILPKLKLVGVVDKPLAEVPVAESVTLTEPLAAEMFKLPVALPTLLGANAMLNCALCPAPNVKGKLNPLIE